MDTHRIDRLDETLGQHPGAEPDQAGNGQELPVQEGQARQRSLDRTKASIERNLEQAEREEAAYEAAKAKLTSRIHKLRDDIQRETAGLDKDERDKYVAGEVKAAAGEFKDSEQLAILKKLLPDLPSADTARQKFTALIVMGLKRGSGDRNNFRYRFQRMFGEDVDEEMADRYEELEQRLEEIENEARSSDRVGSDDPKEQLKDAP